MGLKRRVFLEQTGLMLAALGFSEAGLSLLTERCQQALAQPTRRKLALLIGINQYPETVCDYVPRGSALSGCLTDVQLQQALLIHRFGFQPQDILMLTDETATRQAITDAFINHLVQQAKPDDVVLFHFSGLGSQIQIADTAAALSTANQPTANQRSLVPIDGILPTADNPVIHDLPEQTLRLLLQSLPTDQVITILDTSYASVGRNFQGNLRIRSRPSMPIGTLDAAELALQAQLQAELSPTKLNRAQWTESASEPWTGLVLQASAPNRVATEMQWNGFSAGLFTYALTQQLWWATPATAAYISFNRASGMVKQAAGTEQQPVLRGEKSQKLLPILAEPRLNADGVIRSIDEEGKASLWLAGLPAVVLENAGASLFSLVAAEPSSAPASTSKLLQVRSREGLTVKVRGLPADSVVGLQIGQLVQEAVRMLPRNISLTIALDPSLKRIERVDATSAFSAIPRVSSVIAGEQPADFLFGKTQPPVLAAALPSEQLVDTLGTQTAQDIPSVPETPTSAKNSYGLFYLGRDAIPNTLIQEAEAVKTSVNRMTAQLKTLLAIKLLRLTQNQGSSRLGVRAALETVAPQERLVLQQETVRAVGTLPPSKVATLLLAEGSPTLTAGSQIQYRLQNYSDRPVYFLLIGLDTKGNAVMFYPPSSEPAATVSPLRSAIPPGDTRIIPQMGAANWLVQPSLGLTETHLIFSRAPFTQAFQVLEAEMRSKVDVRPVAALLNPLEVVEAVLQDLHQASSATVPIEVSADSYALDVNAWATLSFVYQVVEA